jgi:hypothetical protein
MNATIAKLLALPDGPERDAAFDEAKRLTVAWMPYKLRTHLVQITLTQPWLVGWRRPLFWNQWFDVVDLEGRAVTPLLQDVGISATRLVGGSMKMHFTWPR